MAPVLVFLPEESHGERTLAGYGPQGCKELDTTEATQHKHTHARTYQSRGRSWHTRDECNYPWGFPMLTTSQH